MGRESMSSSLLILAFLRLLILTNGAPAINLANTLQALESMGLSSGSPPEITVGKGKRKGDSPIYYIKLPPMPYYYAENSVTPVQPPATQAAHQFHQLNVDFTTNGRPANIYHWNYKPVIPAKPAAPPPRPPAFMPNSPAYTASDVDTIIQNSIILPAGIPVISNKPVPTKPKKPTMSNIMSLDKNFVYNGKPSGLYIWKPNPIINPVRYKHHYFKHFNY